MQQHQFKHHTPAAEQPHLAQVRLEADMLRGAVLAAAVRGTVRGVRALTSRMRQKAA